MSSLKVILESHPMVNLREVIKAVKSEVAPKLAFSKDKKKHTKAMLVDHILKLDKLGLIKKLPDMYVKPKRKPRTKAITTEAGVKVKFTEKAKKAGFKVVKPKTIKTKAVTKVAKPKQKVRKQKINFVFEKSDKKLGDNTSEGKKTVRIPTSQAIADSLMTPSKKSPIDELKEMPDFKPTARVKGRSAKQKANDKRLGEAARARKAAKSKK